jgi:hypothetical protein
MPETNYRALCFELLQFGDQAGEIAANEGLWPDCDPGPDWLLDRARAALAQPEPVPPTDEDLEDLAEVMNVSGNPVPAMRRALEMWGHQ